MNAIIQHAVPLLALGLVIGANSAALAAPPATAPSQVTAERANGQSKARFPLLSDSEVLQRIHRANLRAIELGELAKKKADWQEVAYFATDLAERARGWQIRVRDISTQLKIPLATLDEDAREGDSEDSKALDATTTTLRGLSGTAFDEALVSAIRADRDALINLLTRQVSPSAAVEVHALAEALLPLLRQDRARVDALVTALAAQRRS